MKKSDLAGRISSVGDSSSAYGTGSPTMSQATLRPVSSEEFSSMYTAIPEEYVKRGKSIFSICTSNSQLSFLYFFKAMPSIFRVVLIVNSLSKAKVVLFGLSISL